MRPICRFRLLGIPVAVQAWFLVMAVAFSWSDDLQWAVVWGVTLVLGILWHELGHALAMRAFGYPPAIELVAMGGLAHWPEDADPTARERLLVAAAGPGAGLVLGGAAWALRRYGPPLAPLPWLAVHAAVQVNLWWSLFNLLPILPLDGSQVADSATRWVNGRREPRWVGWASLLAGGGVALYALTRQSLWLGLLGGMGALAGWRRAGLGDLRARRGARPGGPAGAARQRARTARARGDLEEVVAALLPEARIGALPEAGLADLVGAMVRTGREAELVELVRRRLTGFARRADAGPLAQLALDGLAMTGAHAGAAEVAQLAFRQLRAPHHAYDAAVHLVALERPDEALDWLRKAADAGLGCGPMMLSDPSLAPLRDRPDFLELATRAGAEPGAA